MIAFLAWSLFAVLVAIAALHLYWAAGGMWPAHDEHGLARMVVGAANEAMPPKALTIVVALVIATAAFVPLWVAGLLSLPFDGALPSWARTTVCFAGGLVFGLRGSVGLTPQWARLLPKEPFASLNRRFYSPLCIGLGLGFAAIALSAVDQS